MHAFAAATFAKLAPQVSPDATVVITSKARAVGTEAFLDLPIAGELLVWAPIDGEGLRERWTFAGRGEAVRLDAGPASLESEAAKIYANLTDLRDEGSEEIPSPRFFGGVAFRTGERSLVPWADFGDASFVMPRWCYAQGERGAFLRLTVRGAEIRSPGKLLNEIANVERLLEAAQPPRAPRPGPPARLHEVGQEPWADLVNQALVAIRTGQLSKVVPARQSSLHAEGPFDPVTVVNRLRHAEVGCVSFALQRGSTVFLGASPERLVVQRGCRIEAEALAGSTARVLDDHLDDERKRSNLLASDKDRREHAFVVTGIRQALDTLCDSIECPDVPTVRTLRTVIHLSTVVTARLRESGHILSVLAALHPTPAVCGLPREAADAWLAAHELAPRGWYAAPIGWFDRDGNGSFAVAIRSAVVRGRDAWLYVGAGIVQGSDAAREYAETAVKQSTMLNALRAVQ